MTVDPGELHQTAGQLDTHASGFGAAYQAAQARAGKVALGSGLASAGLPGMLAAWAADATRYGAQFAKHAKGHRDAADAYVRTDTHGAGTIDDAVPRS